jgi:hypothetical protein
MTNKQLIQDFVNAPNRDRKHGSLSVTCGVLYSYALPIAKYSKEGRLEVLVRGGRTHTTSRHLALVREYTDIEVEEILA